MPYQADWLVDKVVLHIRCTGKIKDEDLPELNTMLISYLNEGESPIHVISDLSGMRKSRRSLQASQRLLPVLNDYRWGWIMIVGTNPITQFLSKLLTHLFRLKMRSFKTIDEAKYALSIEDPRLADIFIASATAKK